MTVGKKIKRMLSFKKEKSKKEKSKRETTTTTMFDEQASKSETLPLDPKKRSSSLVSLRRVFSFKKEKRPTAAAAAAAADPATSLLVTPAESNRNSYQSQTNEAAPVESSPEEKAPVEVVADVLEVTNEENLKGKEADTATEEGFEVLEKTEIDEEKLKQEEEAAKGYVKLPELVEVIEAAQQLSDELKQLESLEKELEKKSEEPEEVKEEPAVLTDVITTIHDKTETAQTGNEIIRTVEIEQERTLTGDGATVLSSSTKTTTTSVAIDGVGNGHVKTEVKKEVLPPVVTRCPVTKEKNNMQIAKSSSRYPLAIACVVIAVVVAVLYGYRDARMLLTF